MTSLGQVDTLTESDREVDEISEEIVKNQRRRRLRVSLQRRKTCSGEEACNGDEAGSLKGMVKPMGGSKSKFLKGSSKVKAQGKKMVPHLTPTSHNGGNLPAGGVHCAPSQTKVLVHV